MKARENEHKKKILSAFSFNVFDNIFPISFFFSLLLLKNLPPNSIPINSIGSGVKTYTGQGHRQ